MRDCALPIIAFGVIVAVLYFGRVFFMTALAAIIIAFILDPFVSILVKIKFPRTVASLVVCAMAALILYLAGLGAYQQIASLWVIMPSLSERIGQIEDAAQQQIANLEERVYKVVVPKRQIQQEAKVEPPPPKPSRNRKKADPTPQPAQPIPGVIQEVRIHNDENPVNAYISARIGTFCETLLMASLNPLPGLLHAELAGPYSSQLSPFLSWWGPGHCGAQPARGGRYGAGVRGRELRVGMHTGRA